MFFDLLFLFLVVIVFVWILQYKEVLGKGAFKKVYGILCNSICNLISD